MRRFLMCQNGSVSMLFIFLWCSVGSSIYGVEGKIAFTSNRDGEEAIYIMDADGGNPFELTEGSNPSWLPDGQSISFLYRGGLWVTDLNGSTR